MEEYVDFTKFKKMNPDAFLGPCHIFMKRALCENS